MNRKINRSGWTLLTGCICRECGSRRVVAVQDDSIHGPGTDGCLDCETTWPASETLEEPAE